jgi:hypothetical protein
VKIGEIKIDPAKQEQGAWVKDIPEMGEVQLKVRGTACVEFRKLQAQLIEQVPRSRRVRGRLSQEDQDSIMDACLHRVALLDWKGFQNDDGSELPYDRDLAKTFISDPAYRKIREAILWAASSVAEDLTAVIEDVVGNSPTPSAGSSNGAAANPS